MAENQLDEALARDQVRAISGFYYHFIIFVGVIAVLAGINAATGGAFWVHWVLIGWGLGVAYHAYLVFVRKPQHAAELKARHSGAATRT